MSCVTCKLNIKDKDEKIIGCDSCNVTMHLNEKCTGLSPSELRAIVIQKRVILFFCEDCRGAFKRVPVLIKKLDEMQHIIESLQKEVQQLKDQKEALNMEAILHEAQERQVRSNNFMLYNVNESNSGIIEERINADTTVVNKILEKVDVPLENLVKVTRVGKKGGKPRPLKIKLSNSQTVFKILRNKNKLTGTHISGDYTYMQREQMKAARSELNQREETGERDLTIKFHNGVPKVVPKENRKN